MFNDKQTQVLMHDLDSTRIKQRSKANITLSYLEGFDIIDTANKIFGYGNWDYTIKELALVSQELNSNQNHIICYKAILRVVVHDISHSKLISREDVGFGSGIAKILSEAHEGAAKEAVTDALKRAMRSFGNQFGNSLYNKSNNHHNQSNFQPQPQIQQPSNQQARNNIPQDYSNLYSIGLTVLEQGSNLVVIGDDIFNKRDSIKACGFRWDGNAKMWYKPLEQQVA